MARKSTNSDRRTVRWLIAGLLSIVLSLRIDAAAAIETPAAQAFIIDAMTGVVLLEKNADARMPPASMSKIMTIYMVFEQLRDGYLALDDTFSVSEKAWRKGGSKMFVEVDTRVSVEDLLRGIIVQSGNDASIVVAEGLAGSEELFAREMTRRARELGLLDSQFVNSTGWPDPEHHMTARDLAKLAKLTVDNFPEFYKLYAETEFSYNGISQGNRNPLLYKNIAADGLKTGHTNASGYGLTASASRNGRRLILVINGLQGTKQRSREAERLIEWGFREFNNYTLFSAGETVEEGQIWLGQSQTVPLIIESDLVVTLPVRSRKDLRVSAVFEEPIPAPIQKGAEIAKLVVAAPGIPTRELPLVAGADVDRLGTFARMFTAIKYLLWGAPE